MRPIRRVLPTPVVPAPWAAGQPGTSPGAGRDDPRAAATSLRRRICLALAAAALAACDGSTTVEAPPAAGTGSLELEVLRGNDQAGVVGGVLPQPVVLRVRTPEGVAVRGVEVGVEQGSGMLTANQSWRTGDDGTAGFYWQLGERAGPQAVVFVLRSGTRDSTARPAIVRALATPDRPSVVTPLAKQALVGATPVAVDVLVTDQHRNRVAGARIRWTATQGALEESLTRSGPDGVATARWTPPAEPSIATLEARLADTGAVAPAGTLLYRLKLDRSQGEAPAGEWQAVSWAFFRDSLHQDRITDLVAAPPYLTGNLTVVRAPNGSGYQWFWQDSWGDYGADFTTGDALPGPDSSLRTIIRTMESDLECDWGPCAIPFQGAQRFLLEGDHLTIESMEAGAFWSGYNPPRSTPAWSRLVLRRR